MPTRKAIAKPKPTRPRERVSRFDTYQKELRQKHAEAEGNVKRLDLDIAEATAALDAMMNERADWADIQNHASHMILSGRIIEGTHGIKSPEITDRRQDEDGD